MKPKKRKRDLYFLKLLSRSFPNVATASTEIINLEAILNLPKGTEHFLADLSSWLSSTCCAMPVVPSSVR